MKRNISIYIKDIFENMQKAEKFYVIQILNAMLKT